MISALAKKFVWTTQDGEQLEPREMRTSHLFYALRMIFNHTVPAPWRLSGGSYNGPSHWPIAYRKLAVAAFVEELKTRWEDLNPQQIRQLEHMANTLRSLNLKGINQ